MQEFLINKEELRMLIEESGDDQNRIAITFNPKRPKEGIRARAVRFEGGKTIESPIEDTTVSTNEALMAAAQPLKKEIAGCPNPPGC